MVASEAAPFIKTGGLAELSRECVLAFNGELTLADGRLARSCYLPLTASAASQRPAYSLC